MSELRPASEIVQCSECGRSLFHQRWIALEPESAEMLALMVKKIHGLDGKRLRLVDAKFVWTEPHSRRIKIQVQVEGEALANVTLRQSTVLEFKQNVQQCPLCRKASLDRQWTHCVQIRQRIEEDSGAHRKTFLRIEQDLIKFGLDRHILSVEENNQGMDLFFSGRGDAKVILDWLKSHLPVQMSSQPTKHGSTYTFNVEIPPINKFDLVAFPLGNGLAKLSLISKVSSVLHFVDPITAERMEVTGTDYWKFHSSKSSATTQISKGKAKSKIRSVSSSTGGTSSLAAVSNFSVLSRRKNMTEFVVIEVDSDPVMSRNFKSSSSDPSSKIFYVTLMRDSDFGVNDEVLHTQTHIGSILQPGDSVLGYEIENMILTDAQLESLSGTDLPYVVLVQKIYKEDRDAPDRQPPPLLRRLARPPPSS